MEQNTKERKTTMMLVKRAKLAQELAELDALLNSQLDSPHNVGSRLSSQPLLSSDNSVLKKSMTNDTSDCGQLALKRLKTVSSAFATTSSVSHESGNQLVESSHKKSLRKKQATIYMETCSDWSDCTDYSDADYAPDSEESSAQDEDACLYPTAKKPLRSLRYPLLSPVKQDDGSESSIGEKWPKVLRRGPQALLQRESSLLTVQIAMCPLQRKYPKNSKERRNKLNILRRRGNFAHNASVVKKGAGELQACYRPKKLKDAFDFIHCYHCQGLYAKKTLWKHMRRCPAKNNSDDESSTGKHRVRSKCALKTAVPHDIGEGLKSVISCMKYDKVTQLIQNDKQLLQFGQHLYDLNGSRKNRHDYIRQRLRELGRLLLTAQKSTPIQKAEELIYPANFNHLISAVKELAGYNPTNNTFRKPTLALKIGNSLGIICELVETDNLSSVDGDSSLVRFAREFKTIKNFRWKGLITRGATTTMTESKWNSPQILPLTEDVKRLDSHMENVKAIAEKMLRSSPTASNYAMLAKVTLAQVIIFNRRREGEVSRMELSTFKERKKSEINEDMAACLTPLEKKMCDFFTRVEIRGKRGRGVPVLLKPSMVSAMELLVESRESCCIPKDNVYMFARPGALSAYRGGECIQKFARECHAKNPDVLTSTRLRKHIATMSQVLNLQENEADQLANFLGHDIRVHRQYYRLPQGTLQLAKMSKVLLALEKGTLSLYKGQALDDIEIDPEERVDLQELDSSSDENDTSLSREAMEVTKAQENEAIENDDDVEPETSSSVTIRSPLKHGNRGNPKQKWEDSEVRAVERHMMRFIHTCKVPQKMDCIRCINAEPYALKNQNWTGVKNYV
uniref:Si:dkey-51d8.9 n=1 Tax=Nothobranchius rachovii TaxID=451742 RepID=A0A1A8S1J5_9TELE